MTRLQYAHALVRHAIGHRKPAAHGPAFRLTALLTGLAISTTTLAAATRASAAERAPARRPASAGKTTLVSIVGSVTQIERHRRPASSTPGSNHRAVLTAAHGTPSGSTAPPESAFAGPTPTTGHEPPPLLPAPKQDIAPQDVPPGEVTAPNAAPPGNTPQNTPPSGTASGGAAPQTATSPQAAAPQGAPPLNVAPRDMPESRRLEQQFAKDILRGNGIRWRSTGGCSDRTVTTCTSFEKIRWGTIKGLIDFAESSGCEITVTGGTERGHANGTYSHWNGYKADIALSRCVDRTIERYPSTGVRGDGARLYRSPDGALFAREKDHWDITFR